MRNERFDFLHLPEQYQKDHKICEFLLYQIEDFILKDEYKGLRVQEIKINEGDELPNDDENILDFLLRTNKNDKHDEIVTGNILNGLISDICQFLQIVLFSSMQSRLTVSFALIRKPFVYDLLIILRLYFTKDFLPKFNNDTSFDTTKLTEDDKILLLEMSEQVLISNSIKASDIYNFIFNQKLPDSIINLSNKALHPSTTRTENNSTAVQNLNFVFSTSNDKNAQWEYLYNRLPLLLLYLNEVLEFIVFDYLKLDNSIYAERLTERADYLDQNAAW